MAGTQHQPSVSAKSLSLTSQGRTKEQIPEEIETFIKGEGGGKGRGEKGRVQEGEEERRDSPGILWESTDLETSQTPQHNGPVPQSREWFDTCFLCHMLVLHKHTSCIFNVKCRCARLCTQRETSVILPSET